MDATRFIHLHCKEFEFLLASQALLWICSSIQGSLGPTPRHTLQDLLCIPSQNHEAQLRENTPLGFNVYLSIHQQGFLGPLRHTIRIYRIPQSSSGVTMPVASCILMLV